MQCVAVHFCYEEHRTFVNANCQRSISYFEADARSEMDSAPTTDDATIHAGRVRDEACGGLVGDKFGHCDPHAMTVVRRLTKCRVPARRQRGGREPLPVAAAITLS